MVRIQTGIVATLAWLLLDVSIGASLQLEKLPDPGNKATPRSFSELDLDHDSVVSLKEFTADLSDSDMKKSTWDFYRRDEDANAYMTQKEFESSPESANNKFLKQFSSLDEDGNLSLSAAEYVKPAGKEYHDAAQQEFSDYDVDANKKLSYSEFLLTPRACLPLQSRFARLDLNHDNALAYEEYLKQSVKGDDYGRRQEFYRHDSDGDLLVNREEFLTAKENQLPHLRSQYAMRDENRDGMMSREEYYKPFINGQWEEAAKREAVIFDKNEDGFLELAEFAVTPLPAYMRSTVFEYLDNNSDSQVSLKELLERYAAAFHMQQTEAFFNRDTDHDSVLSLEEFLVPDQQVEASLYGAYAARDADHDGKVVAQEYFKPHIGGKWEEAAKRESKTYDMDADGYLSLREFAFSPAGEPYRKDLFTLLDSNTDSTLSMAEFVRSRPEPQWNSWKVRFYFYDCNLDRSISREEFVSEKRCDIGDPVAKLVTGKYESCLSLWPELDQDSNGTISSEEWRSEPFTQFTPEVVHQSFHLWDLNSDREITPDDTRTVLGEMYGLCLSEGQPLRREHGRMINWAMFTNLDKDGNEKVSRTEFDPVAATAGDSLFSKLDANQDNNINSGEFVESGHFLVDVVAAFCHIDVDMDGLLTHSEIVDRALPWQEKMSRHLLRAFDTDQDERLSLEEFKWTPYANPVVEWYRLPTDSDNDGFLSWNEYQPVMSSSFLGIVRLMFDQFDRDKDGLLSTSEHDFQLDCSRVPVEIAFAVLDRNENGALDISDVLNANRPESNDPVEVLRWEERQMQIDEMILTADRNSDKTISLDEFSANKQQVIAAITGQSLPRTSVIPAPRTASSDAGNISSESDGWNWRMIGLISFNILILVGVAWMVLRPSASS